jgi:hypothetical protein
MIDIGGFPESNVSATLKNAAELSVFDHREVEHGLAGKLMDSRQSPPAGETLGLGLEIAAVPCRIHWCRDFLSEHR